MSQVRCHPDVPSRGIIWVGDAEGEEKRKRYYAQVQIGEDLFRAGDAAMFFYPDEAGSDVNTFVRRLEHLYEKEDRDRQTPFF